jgi:hypothetical protein
MALFLFAMKVCRTLPPNLNITMANWFYYNASGEKVGPITPTALKALAMEGVITPETKVENQGGRSALAGKVNGLTFPDTIPPTPNQPNAPAEPDTSQPNAPPVPSESVNLSDAFNAAMKVPNATLSGGNVPPNSPDQIQVTAEEQAEIDKLFCATYGTDDVRSSGRKR